MAVPAEVIYPAFTGVFTLAASLVAYRIYREGGNPAILWLSMGLFFVSIQSFMESYINYLIDSNEAFYGSRTHYILDAVRGVFIILWASMQALILVEIGGVESRWIYYGFPLMLFIAGTVFTLDVNMLSGIEDPAHRLLVSSIGRVMGILVPISLLLGAFMGLAIARPTGSRGAAIIGAAFIVHALTLPFYPIAKGMGVFALGAWYAIGGLIPALMAVYGFYVLGQEAGE